MIYCKANYLVAKVIIHEAKGELEESRKFQEELFDHGTSILKGEADEELKRTAALHLHFYWNKKAKISEKTLRDFEKIAEYYKKSADVLKGYDEHKMYDELVNYHKALALANRKNQSYCLANIDQAIQYAQRRGDIKQISYLQGLKHDHLSTFCLSSGELEEATEHLKLAQESYFISGAESEGRDVEFKFHYFESQKLAAISKFEESLSSLEKAAQKAKNTKFPNVIPSPDILVTERIRLEALHNFAKGEFQKAVAELEDWLAKSRSIEKTKKFQFHLFLKELLKIASKDRFCGADLILLEGYINQIRGQRVSLAILKLASLVYSNTALWLNGIRDSEVLEKVKVATIGCITGQEIVEELKRNAEVQRSLVERIWLHKLPEPIEEQFDKSLYFLSDVTDEFKHCALREFYILLEKFLAVVVEFNARVFWKDKWRIMLEENKDKEFEKFALGDLTETMKQLVESKIVVLQEGPSRTFELLKRHTEIRNRLSHEFVFENSASPEVIVGEIEEIMFSLLDSFPLCIRVKSTKKRPRYETEVLWTAYPRVIALFCPGTVELLEGEIYYVGPISQVRADQRELCPVFVTSCRVLRTLLGLPPSGQELNYART